MAFGFMMSGVVQAVDLAYWLWLAFAVGQVVQALEGQEEWQSARPHCLVSSNSPPRGELMAQSRYSARH
jgi:hypothetical protein